MTLYVPEIGAIGKIQVIYGLVLERALGGYWVLSAQAPFGVLGANAVPMNQTSPEFHW